MTGQYSSWLYSPVDQGLSPMTELEGGFADGYVTAERRAGHVRSRRVRPVRVFVSPT